MPIRSLNSVVLKWPGRDQVLASARRWAAKLRRDDQTVERILCIGSCARGDWGVGSDLDAVVIVADTSLSPFHRLAHYEPRGLPVPVDLWVYTQEEWDALASHSPHLWRRLQREAFDLA